MFSARDVAFTGGLAPKSARLGILLPGVKQQCGKVARAESRVCTWTLAWPVPLVSAAGRAASSSSSSSSLVTCAGPRPHVCLQLPRESARSTRGWALPARPQHVQCGVSTQTRSRQSPAELSSAVSLASGLISYFHSEDNTVSQGRCGCFADQRVCAPRSQRGCVWHGSSRMEDRPTRHPPSTPG